MEEVRNAYKILLGNLRDPLGHLGADGKKY
jgi:hypothetical protein